MEPENKRAPKEAQQNASLFTLSFNLLLRSIWLKINKLLHPNLSFAKFTKLVKSSLFLSLNNNIIQMSPVSSYTSF